MYYDISVGGSYADDTSVNRPMPYEDRLLQEVAQRGGYRANPVDRRVSSLFTSKVGNK